MNDIIICDTPDKVQAYRLLSLKAGLGLEVKGMKHSRFSAFKIVKAEFGLKGNKATVLAQFIEILKEKGILVR